MGTPALAGAILDGLQKANGIIALASVAEGIVVPFIQGLVKDFQTKTNADGTVEYTVILSTGMQELDQVEAQAVGDLTTINAYLVSKGQQPIAIPDTSNPSSTSAPSAPSNDTKKT